MKTFPNQLPNKLLFYGHQDSTTAFIATYDVSSSTWSWSTTANTYYITDVIYAGSYFYLVPHAGTWSNKLLKCLPADILNPSNWTVIDLPTFSGSTEPEVRITYFNGYMYILRSNKKFYFDVLKWDLSSSFTTILSNSDTTDPGFLIFPYIRSSTTRLAVTLPYSTPSYHFVLKYSDDGTNFNTVTSDLSIFSSGAEQHCFAIPYGNEILVCNVRDGNTSGFVAFYSLTGTQLESHAVNNHYTEAMILVDGSNLVLGGESSPSYASASIKILSGTDSGNNVHLGHKSRTDFGDVRFTGSDGTTLLSYWMETYTSNNFAVFWVKVPNDLSTNPATIYIYYGNPSATTTSSGTDTFLFFDHFDSSTETLTFYGAGTWSRDTANSIIKWTPNTAGDAFAVKDVGVTNALILTRCNIGITDSAAGAGARLGDISNWYDGLLKEYYEKLAIEKKVGGTWSSISETSMTVNTNTWYRVQFGVSGTSLKAYAYSDSYTLLASVSTTDSSLTTQTKHGLEAYKSSTTTSYQSYDFLAIAKYIDPEPSHGSWGSEESGTYLVKTFIVYTQGVTAASTSIPTGTISASDVDSNMSPTGLSSDVRSAVSACGNNDLYLWYIKSGNLYRIKYSGGTWSSETQVTTTGNENYPSVSLTTTNRIDYIWTHYTGSTYNVYYDSLSFGNIYSRALTEAVTFSSSLLKSGNFGRVLQATASLSSVIVRAGVFSRVRVEIMTFSSQVGKSVVITRVTTITEQYTSQPLRASVIGRKLAVTSADSASLLRLGVFSKIVTAIGSVTSQLIKSSIISRISSALATLSSSATRQYTALRIDTAIMTCSESIKRASILIRILQESATYSSLSDVVVTFLRAITATLSAVASAIKVSVHGRVIQQSQSLSSQPLRVSIFRRSQAEAVTMSTQSLRQIVFSRSSAASSTLSSVLSRTIAFTRTVAANIGFSSVVTKAQVLTRNLAGSLVQSITAMRTLVSQRIAASSHSFVASPMRTVVIQRIITTSYTASSLAAKALVVFRSVAETITHIPSVSRSIVQQRTLQEIATGSANLIRTIVLSRAAQVSISLSSQAQRILVGVRNLAETVQAYSVLTKSASFNRNILEIITQTSSAIYQLIHAGVYNRTLTESSTFSAQSLRTLTCVRIPTASVSWSSVSERALILTRSVTASLQQSVDAIRMYVITRISAVSFNFTSSLLRGVTQIRIVSVSSTYTAISLRVTSFSRSLVEVATYASESLRSYIITRVIQETYTVLSEVVKSISLSRIAQAATSWTSRAARTLETSRIASVAMEWTTISRRASVFPRSVIELATYTSQTIRGFVVTRTMQEIYSASSSVSRSIALSRIIHIITDFTSVVSRTIVTSRIVSIVETFASSVSKSLSISRILQATESCVGDTVRTVSVTRAISQFIGYASNSIRTLVFQRIVTSVTSFGSISSWTKGAVLTRVVEATQSLVGYISRSTLVSRTIQQMTSFISEVLRLVPPAVVPGGTYITRPPITTTPIVTPPPTVVGGFIATLWGGLTNATSVVAEKIKEFSLQTLAFVIVAILVLTGSVGMYAEKRRRKRWIKRLKEEHKKVKIKWKHPRKGK